ncbi:MAG: PilZ domain-containing protein [Nitrospiraceae bacterium]
MEQDRKHDRFPVDCPICFSSDKVQGEGTVYNLSLGGCAIRSTARIQKGEYLTLQLYLISLQTPIKVELAPVRWVNGQEVGLEFMTMPREDQRRLQDYVSTLSPEPSNDTIGMERS